MDYRDHIAHLLEHMERKPSFVCDRSCPVAQSKHGGIVLILTYSGPAPEPRYEGPAVSILLEAMTKMNLAVTVERGSEKQGWSGENYYPTSAGIEFRKRTRHPRKFWINENWFPLAVAITTAVLALASIVIDIVVK